MSEYRICSTACSITLNLPKQGRIISFYLDTEYHMDSTRSEIPDQSSVENEI